MMVAVASAEAVASVAEALGAAVEEELVGGARVARRHLAVLLLHPPTLGEVEVARLK